MNNESICCAVVASKMSLKLKQLKLCEFLTNYIIFEINWHLIEVDIYVCT